MNLINDVAVPSNPTHPPTTKIIIDCRLCPLRRSEKRAGSTNARSVPVNDPTRSKTSPNDGLLMAADVTRIQRKYVRAACHRITSCLPLLFGSIQVGGGTIATCALVDSEDSSPAVDEEGLDKGDGLSCLPFSPPTLDTNVFCCSCPDRSACVASLTPSHHSSSMLSLLTALAFPNFHAHQGVERVRGSSISTVGSSASTFLLFAPCCRLL
mmetsp:Transcript_17400/g.27285  ORF Transcript_17400/g.27285 Transcript_17400/m.27285 type:complete len:211 (-) Transcript_17400:698-1330(-)